MDTVRALTVAVDVDLATFCAYLSQQHVPHRVFEERGRQVLEVVSRSDADRVRADYDAWRDGHLELTQARRPAPRRIEWQPIVAQYPVVTALIVIALVCFPATWPLDSEQLGPVLPWLTIVPISGAGGELRFDSLERVLAGGQWWRLVTPIFIHFGFVHLAFNAAVVVEFGRRIERGAGSLALLLLTLSIAIVSDVAQFAFTHQPLFGGLSGVAYGLVAYVVVRGRFDRAERVWYVIPSFTVAVVAMLLVMSSGVTEWFGLHIANTAHWVGLVLGGAAAIVWRPRGDSRGG
jgi:GlpG protein